VEEEELIVVEPEGKRDAGGAAAGKGGVTSMSPKAVAYPDRAGEWRWRLVGGNGEIQATGEGHKTQEHAREAITTVAINFAKISGLLEAAGLTEEEIHVPVEVLTLEEAKEFDEDLNVEPPDPPPAEGHGAGDAS
jgi:uncharacterized protein YegP (UPF0339 family)